MVTVSILPAAFSICKYVNGPASAIKYYPSGFLNLGVIAPSKSITNVPTQRTLKQPEVGKTRIEFVLILYWRAQHLDGSALQQIQASSLSLPFTFTLFSINIH